MLAVNLGVCRIRGVGVGGTHDKRLPYLFWPLTLHPNNAGMKRYAGLSPAQATFDEE